jgi:hypothetical protein
VGRVSEAILSRTGIKSGLFPTPTLTSSRLYVINFILLFTRSA